MIRRMVTSLLFSFFLPAVLLAQGPGKISGKVTDASTGEPLIGATVVVEGTQLGSATGVDGSYFILNIRPGSYTLRATYIGYTAATITNVIVTSELTTEVNLRMNSEAVEIPAVEIIAERPLVNKSATNAIYTMRVEDIKNIPVRGYLDVIALQPGVVKLGNNLFVRGGRADEVAYFIDGMIVNNPFNSRNAGSVVTESIEEVTYQAGGFNAEYGFANAGLVSTTTRAGGQKFSVAVGAITDEFLPRKKAPTDPIEKIRLGRQAPSGFKSYGTSIFHASLGGPLPVGDDAVRFHLGVQRTVALDGNPTSASAYYLPDNRSSETALNPNLTFDYKPVNVRVGGFSSFNKSRGYSRFHSVFNESRNSKTEASTHAYHVKWTHTLGTSTFYTAQGTWFQTETETGDPVWFDDIDSYGDPAKNPVLSGPGRNPAPVFHNLFAGAGYVNFGYNYNRSSYIGGKVDVSHQLDKTHLFKVGGEFRYNTIRFWTTNTSLFSQVKAIKPGLTREEILRNSYTNNLGVAVDGVAKGRNTFLDNGRNGAPHPIIASGYFQDKIELEDLVLNVGLRYDYFDANVDVYKDPTNIIIESDPSGNFVRIAESNFVPGEGTHTLSPRLGVSFPITDRTVFHAQYGHFTQHVELNRLYTSTTVLAQQLTAGNYVNVGNPSLKPEKTISYEVGFSQQLGDNASMGIIAYYKDVRDLIQLQNINAKPVQYARFVNGDFGTVKGASLSFDLRRTNRVAANVNYTLQYASGTGSAATSNFNIAWLSGNFPTFVTPLDFDQRHTGSLNLDFRTLADDGPTFMDGKPFGEVGVNLLFTFGSGRAYTPARPKTILFGPTWEQPIAAHNQTYSPWNFQIDAKVNKTFHIGSINANVYFWLLNALNTRNTTFVYNFSGLPDDDGYFKTPDGQAYAEREGQEAVDGYRFRLANPNNYGPPRQLRLGIRLEYN